MMKFERKTVFRAITLAPHRNIPPEHWLALHTDNPGYMSRDGGSLGSHVRPAFSAPVERLPRR
jgi:hypothetical protein